MTSLFAFLDSTLDAWLSVRVAAHEARASGAIDVPVYLHALRVVRQAEDVIEPMRRRLGSTSSRAFELVTTDEQLALKVAA